MSIESLQQLTPPGGWLTTPQTRLPPLDKNGASLTQRLLIQGIRTFGRVDAPNLWLMLMHNTRLLRGFLGFASRMMPYGELPRRDTELVILRVAWNCRSRYEWGQHVNIGLRAGLLHEEIIRITEGPDAYGWDSRQMPLIRAADEIHHERMVSEATWRQLVELFDQRLLLELLMLIGFYEGLAGVLNSTGLPLDPHLQASAGDESVRH